MCVCVCVQELFDDLEDERARCLNIMCLENCMCELSKYTKGEETHTQTDPPTTHPPPLSPSLCVCLYPSLHPLSARQNKGRPRNRYHPTLSPIPGSQHMPNLGDWQPSSSAASKGKSKSNSKSNKRKGRPSGIAKGARAPVQRNNPSLSPSTMDETAASPEQEQQGAIVMASQQSVGVSVGGESAAGAVAPAGGGGEGEGGEGGGRKRARVGLRPRGSLKPNRNSDFSYTTD